MAVWNNTYCSRAVLPRIGIQWCADEIYVRKFCAAVVDLLINLDNFWLLGYV